MKRYSQIALALSMLAVPAMAHAQGSGVEEGTAVVSGENPYIRLEDKQGGTSLTAVSFWRVHWSPVGTGHVCYVTIGERGQAGAVRIALYDNERLFNYMTKDVLGLQDKSYAEWPFEAVGGATFTPGGDSIRNRIETCKSRKYDVKLAWNDLQKPELLHWAPGSRPNSPFGLTFLRLIGTTAEVTVNGKRAPGTAFGRAALAFGETWLKK